MANVSLKKDFKNGEKLYDHQLNNNFAAIEAALGAMNKIVWQDDADDSVVAFRGTTEELAEREIIDGQLLYDTTTGETFIDYDGERISTGSGNAIHIGEDAPTNPSTQLWIDTDDIDATGSELVDEYSEDPTKGYNTEYINGINTYSTSETFTGKYWKDGKKIYSKYIFAGTIGEEEGTEDQTFTLLENVDFLTDKIAWDISTTSGQIRALPLEGVVSTLQIGWFIDNHVLTLKTHREGSVPYANSLVYCLVEYTKVESEES